TRWPRDWSSDVCSSDLRISRKAGRALLFLDLLSLPLPLLAQTSRGAIAGTVLDNSGAAVPGASVEAKEPHTGSTYATQSTDTGNYIFSELPPGSYDLTFSKSGFKTTT